MDAPTRSNTSPTRRLLRIPAVVAQVSIPRSSLWPMIARGAFPRPIKIGRSSFWVSDEVDAWIAERIAAGRATAPEVATH